MKSNGVALLLDEEARTDTYPTMRLENSQVEIGHEATVSKELPMEYAVELNRLIQLEMEGSVG